MTRLTGTHWHSGAGVALTLEGGRIASIAPCETPDPGLIAPALVDLQVNGWAGRDLNDGALTLDTVRALCRDLAVLGVGAFLPTLITASREALCDALAAIRAAREDDAIVARMIPGIHVEGPAISPQDGPRGAHPLAHVRALSLAEVTEWQAAAGGLVRMVTLAPEWPETPALIRGLAAQGILVALGHTAASTEQIHAAAEAGARLSTHLGNGSAALLPRHPNHIWAQLADDRLTATFIADGHHLPADTFRAMLRAKGPGRALLVSDSVAHAGLPPGRYETAIGGAVEVSRDGRIAMAGTPYLAGAGLPLIADVGRAMALGGLSVAEALRLATTVPAALLGREAEIAPGAPADLIRVFPEAEGLTLAETWIAGERIGA